MRPTKRRTLLWKGRAIGHFHEQGSEMFEVYGRFEPFDHPLSHEFVADAKRDGPAALVVGVADEHGKLLEVHYLGMLDADGELWLKRPFGRAERTTIAQYKREAGEPIGLWRMLLDRLRRD